MCTVCARSGLALGLVVAGRFWCSYAWVSLTLAARLRPRGCVRAPVRASSTRPCARARACASYPRLCACALPIRVRARFLLGGVLAWCGVVWCGGVGVGVGSYLFLSLAVCWRCWALAFFALWSFSLSFFVSFFVSFSYLSLYRSLYRLSIVSLFRLSSVSLIY